jgi:hypothetical protein
VTPSAGLDYFVVTPCRIVDTRQPLHAPALAANTTRNFTVAGLCGVPANAAGVAVVLTAVQPTANGNLRLYPAGATAPLSSSINFSSGQTRANNATAAVGVGGAISVQCDLSLPTGSTHFVLDVYGYFAN